MTRQFYFTNPESFDPREFLTSPKLAGRWEDSRLFIGLILTKLARGQADDSGMVRLRAGYLRNVMHNRDSKAVVDALLERGAVWRTAYKKGEKPFGYRLSDRFIGDRHVRLPITDAKLIRRLEAFHANADRDRKARMKPIHFALERQQHRLRIHGDEAREIIAGLPPKSNPFDVQGVLVADIEQRDFHCNVGRYGRLANNITSLKREIRSALHIDGQPLQSVDIACCQPALIGKIVRDGTGAGRHGAGKADRGEQGRGAKASIYDAQSSGPTEGDLERYCSAVQAGTFYELMVAELSDYGISRQFKKRFLADGISSRDQFKKRFLADVIAKKKANRQGAEYPSDVEDCFRVTFPTVYGFIRDFNGDGWHHENLIRELQRQESAFVIEIVAAELVAQYPLLFIISLHDAIYSTARHIPKVVRAFKSAFAENDFSMSLKIATG